MKFSDFLALVVIFFSCTSKNNQSGLFIERQSTTSGITFSNQLDETGDINIIEYLYFYNGGGVGVADFNKDGLEDLFFTGNQVPNALYINQGGWVFEDRSLVAGINVPQKGWSTGVSIVDINNDGWMDIYICQVSGYAGLEGHNLLFVNNKDLTFSEMSKEFGLDFKGFSTQAAFFDADRDGDMDMYLLNHSVHTPYSYQPASSRTLMDIAAGDRFYVCESTNQQITYKEVTSSVGIYSGSQGFGLGIVIEDFNQDQWPDIYVANDFHEDDFLYINQKDGSFRESRKDFFAHTSRFSMGVDAADLNQDGRLDLMTVDMLPFEPSILLKSGGEDREKVAEIKRLAGYSSQVARNVMQISEGNRFIDIALLTDTYATDWSWSVLLEDLDQNGKKDIFISNGIARRPNDLDYINFLSNINLNTKNRYKKDSLIKILIERMPDTRIQNQLFLQMDSLLFKETGSLNGIIKKDYSNGTALVDLDNDGDLDVVINRINEEVALYENKASNSGMYHWLSLEFQKEGRYEMVNGWIYAQGEVFRFSTYPVRGWLSSQSYKATIGLGEIDRIDSLLVNWSDGSFSKYYDWVADRAYSLSFERGNHSFAPTKIEKHSSLRTIENWEHKEGNFLDYDKEPLIPSRLSKEGPAVAVGDVNGDGFQDLYLGGAHGQSANLFFWKEGTLRADSSNSTLWHSERIYEDISAIFFDYDNDGDNDLYVVSGGNEFYEGSSQLADRLYANDGSGKFSKVRASLPTSNGSVVELIEHKKEKILFVGSRNIPASYGQIPNSYLITFSVEGNILPIEKLKLGMVTDARWSKKKGLVVVGDWMPVTLLDFSGDERKISMVPHSLGMWRSVEWADYNRDGELDIVAGNLGLNSKFKISKGLSPVMYVADFDHNGQSEPIIFYPYKNTLIPYPHRDDIAAQLPIIKKDFLSFTQFSNIRSLKELFPSQKRVNLQESKINVLASGIFMAKGSDFSFQPFPAPFQLSPMNDIVYDGNNEIYTAQNFLDAGSNQGPYDAFSGGIITYNEQSSQWKFSKSLQIPSGLAYRHVVQVNDQLIWIANNEKAYILTK